MKYLTSNHSSLWVTFVFLLILVSSVISADIMNISREVYNVDSAVDLAHIKGIRLDGKAFDAATLEGKIVLLDFWAVWCGPCLTAIPDLNRLSEHFADQNLEVIGVAAYSGTVTDVKQVLERFDPNYRIILGELEMLQRFGVIGFPTYFLIDANGVIVKKYVGEVINLYNQILKDTAAILTLRSSGQ